MVRLFESSVSMECYSFEDVLYSSITSPTEFRRLSRMSGFRYAMFSQCPRQSKASDSEREHDSLSFCYWSHVRSRILQVTLHLVQMGINDVTRTCIARAIRYAAMSAVVIES